MSLPQFFAPALLQRDLATLGLPIDLDASSYRSTLQLLAATVDPSTAPAAADPPQLVDDFWAARGVPRAPAAVPSSAPGRARRAASAAGAARMRGALDYAFAARACAGSETCGPAPEDAEECAARASIIQSLYSAFPRAVPVMPESKLRPSSRKRVASPRGPPPAADVQAILARLAEAQKEAAEALAEAGLEVPVDAEVGHRALLDAWSGDGEMGGPVTREDAEELADACGVALEAVSAYRSAASEAIEMASSRPARPSRDLGAEERLGKDLLPALRACGESSQAVACMRRSRGAYESLAATRKADACEDFEKAVVYSREVVERSDRYAEVLSKSLVSLGMPLEDTRKHSFAL